MKKIFLCNAFILAIFTCLIGLSSCSSDGITAVSTNINGPLGEYFEVVDKDYKAIVEEKDDADSKILSISVEFKRIKEGGPTDASWSSRPTFILEVLDAEDNVLEKKPTDVVFEKEELESLFSLKEGQSSSIVFKLRLGEKASEVRKFKISSTWDESKEEKVTATEIETETATETESKAEGSSTESGFSLENVILPSQLKGKVEVINAEKSVGKYGYPEMEITFKLLSTVNTKPLVSAGNQMWIIGVGQTDNGVDVKELLPNYREWRSGDSDGEEFKGFLEGEPGETITLSFSGGKENSSNVSSDLEKVKKFKLKLTK